MAKVVLENIYKSFPSRGGEIVAPVENPSLGIANPSVPIPKQRDKSTHVNILRCINLTVNDGEFMVLVGPSGCGKSTLLRVVAGLEDLTGGNIEVGGRTVNDLPPKQRDIAMVFQNYALYPHLSVYDNIAFGLRRMNQGKQEKKRNSQEQLPIWLEDWLVAMTRHFPKGWRYQTDKERAIDAQVRRVAQLLQIESLLHRFPKQLSGGQKQRVALGRAIARNPQVFLMDEPLSNLDAKLRAETRSQIVQLQRQLGTTTIYVTHDQIEAMTMGDRIAVMNQGEIQQIAPPLELYNHPVNRFVAEFIGSPPMNFLPVKVQSPLLITHAQFRLTLPEVWEPFLQYYDGQYVLLGIRPEHLNISPAATKNLQVEVNLVEALGNDTYISVYLVKDVREDGKEYVREYAKEDGKEYVKKVWQVRIPPDSFVKPGESLWLSMALDKIHLFDPHTEKAIWRN